MEFDPEWEVAALDTPAKEELQKILSQKFYYLGRGFFFYAFASEDGEHVLKFFQFHRNRPSLLDRMARPLPFLPANVANHIEKRFASKKEARKEQFRKVKKSYLDLAPVSGTEWIHLNPTQNFLPKVQLHDKIGCRFSLDLDNTAFLLQKRAEAFFPRFKQIVLSQDQQAIKKIIDSLFDKILFSFHKNFTDTDYVLRTNFGIYHDEVIQFDVSSLEPAYYTNRQQKLDNLHRVTTPLVDFLKAYDKAMHVYAQGKINDLLDEMQKLDDARWEK